MVVTYSNTDPAMMTLYRNKVECGSYTMGSLPTYPKGNTQVIFGARHYYSLQSKWPGNLDATILAAQIHDVALNPMQVSELSIEDIIGTGPLKVGDKIQLQFSDEEPLLGYISPELRLVMISHAATFTVVTALDPSVQSDPRSGMTPVSLQLNDSYLMLGNESGNPQGWYNMELKTKSDPGFNTTAATFQPASGFADDKLLSFATAAKGDNRWIKVHGDFIFSGPIGAPRYTPLATWKVHKK